MLRYAFHRLAIGAGMLLALTVLIFVLLQLTPGDPIDAYVDPNVALSQAELSQINAGTRVQKTSSTDNAHSHTVTFN